MKKIVGAMAAVIVLAGCFVAVHIAVVARANENAISNGVFIGDINVSGMSKEEASKQLTQYVDGMKDVPFTLKIDDLGEIGTTAEELGIKWDNPEVIEEAFSLGKEGNILTRYKQLKDLEKEPKHYDIKLAFDDAAVGAVLEEKGAQFNVEAKDASLKRENGEFIVTEGCTGRKVDIAKSEETLKAFLDGWDGEEATVDMVVAVDEPKSRTEDLQKVTDLLGSFTTSYSTSGADRCANVANGCKHINGTIVYPGEEFSAYEAVSPFTEENGYHLAGSYLNGMVVESLGGGICQVSTTLYNAVLRAELEVTQRFNHSMEVSYVPASADAAIAESSGKDFKFVNNLEYPIYIEGYTENKHITFNVYGHETRDPGHKVTFESEVISEKHPDSEKIITDGSQPIGFVKIQSVHVGKVAKLWKITTENGQEVSREEVNNSSYMMVPRTATVGTATSDPNALAMLQAAIATGSIDQVKATAGSISSGAYLTPALPEIPAEEQVPAPVG